MELANTRLVSAMGLPNIVDVHISRIALTLFDGTTRLAAWPLKHVKRWGVRDGVCSVVFGALSDHPGTLAHRTRKNTLSCASSPFDAARSLGWEWHGYRIVGSLY
jgi:hypothetical protein